MLRLLLVSLPVCSLVGALIGLTCRGRVSFQLVICVVVSIAYFAILEWKIGSPDEWSWAYPIVSAAYLFGPFLILFFAPMFVVSCAVGSWLSRKTTP
jgi:hypothetical protein